MRMERNCRVKIDRLRVRNFKSFDKLDIKFGDFNVIVGENATGKSNLMQVFSFLVDIEEHGLDGAISLQGGNKFIRNLTLDKKKLFVEFTISFSPPQFLAMGFTQRVKIDQMIYGFELELEENSGYQILYEKATFTGKTEDGSPEIFEIYRNSGKEKFILDMPTNYKKREFMNHILNDQIDSKHLLIETPAIHYISRHQFSKFIDDLLVYDLEPKSAKGSIPLRDITKLHMDGSNLALSLDKILSNQKSKSMLLASLRDLLPIIKDITIERNVDRSIHFKLIEKYNKEHALPSSLVSDGSINITALIVILYFQHKSITLIEEPERNIHASLLSDMIKILKDASNFNQIIMTTHSSELLCHVGIDHIYLITRDEQGFSMILKPEKIKDVKDLLENGMGVDQLYVHNLLT